MMAGQSTLAENKSDIAAIVGAHLGYGSNPDKWDEDQLFNIEKLSLKTGQRRFASPSEIAFHKWSFLTPTMKMLVGPVASAGEGFLYNGKIYSDPMLPNRWELIARENTGVFFASAFNPLSQLNTVGRAVRFPTSGTVQQIKSIIDAKHVELNETDSNKIVEGHGRGQVISSVLSGTDTILTAEPVPAGYPLGESATEGGRSSLDEPWSWSGFSSAMVGQYVIYDDGGIFVSAYKIKSVTSGNVCVIEGDATVPLTFGAYFFVTVPFSFDNVSGDFRLPDNFGGISGRITFADSTIRRHTIEVTNDQRIREYRQHAPRTGVPQLAAVRPIGSNPQSHESGRWELMLYPTPDINYTIEFRFNLIADALLDGEFPWGNAPHTETLIEACLAAADLHVNDEVGQHEAAYQRCLQTSYRYDLTATAPEFFGYVGDGSMKTGNFRTTDRHAFRTLGVSVNGVQM